MDYLWLILAIAPLPPSNLLWKMGMLRVGQVPQKPGKLPRFLFSAVSNPFVISGIILNIIAAVASSFAASIFPLSYFYPLTQAVPILLVAVFSILLLKEKVSRMSWMAIVTICVGVVLVGLAMD